VDDKVHLSSPRGREREPKVREEGIAPHPRRVPRAEVRVREMEEPDDHRRRGYRGGVTPAGRSVIRSVPTP
jgi:hypothetical protein